VTAGPPLRGRTIAVTRGEKPGGDPLAARLRALGATVLEVPSIAVAPPASWDALDGALRALASFDWVAFASANGVDAVARRAAELGIALPRGVGGPRLAAVGPATAERLAGAWRAPEVVPARAVGGDLAAALAPSVAGRRVLVPRAEEGRPELVDGLRAAGAEVVAPVAYRTVAAPPQALRPLVDAVRASAVDAIAFASPSAVRSVVAALGADPAPLAHVALAAIGPTTAAALRAAGLAVSIEPARLTAPDLADAIGAWFAAR
jgi:uroporphyrinogen-III synthase/uroporphyrinogen III methyltransferase/synthase